MTRSGGPSGVKERLKPPASRAESRGRRRPAECRGTVSGAMETDTTASAARAALQWRPRPPPLPPRSPPPREKPPPPLPPPPREPPRNDIAAGGPPQLAATT